MSPSVCCPPLSYSPRLPVATSSTSRHSDTREKKKRKGISRRVRQLEKTVENLLSLALTEPQDRTTTADGRKIDNSDVVDTLSAALSGL